MLEHERLMNGLLKGFDGRVEPEALRQLLSQDIEIVCPEARARERDLWPAIWALAAVLERQTYGRVFVRCGLDRALPSPAPLGSSVVFVRAPQRASVAFCLGSQVPCLADHQVIADARSSRVSVGQLFETSDDLPSPIEAFALAGLLGFAAIAQLVGIPPYRRDLAAPVLRMHANAANLAQALDESTGFSCLGLGQLGQAYLALLWFLYRGDVGGRRLFLVDPKRFTSENGRTQVLLAAGASWHSELKADYLLELTSSWNVDAQRSIARLDWGWLRPDNAPRIALLGFDKFDPRRVACHAGFDLLVESGVGTDLLQPRFSWHKVSGDTKLGSALFPRDDNRQPQVTLAGTFVDRLKTTPGECGWVRFKEIDATAPCLGVAAAAFALSELCSSEKIISGRGLLWSQCLPAIREIRHK